MDNSESDPSDMAIVDELHRAALTVALAISNPCVVMGNPSLGCRPDLDVAVQYVAEPVTQP